MKSGLFLFCCLFSIAIYGQRTVSGHVTDASENVPAPGVTVFLSNTSVATVTDADGFYRLSIPGEGRYTLMVSHVAYQPVTKDIEPGNASLKFDVALQPRELDEVTIAKKIRFRKTDINIFYESILGEKPSQKTIWVSNPETVYYFYNESTGKLTVTCREPLQIINQKTGYQIRFILNYFTYDYRTGVADWSHRSSFTALEPENLIQKNKWEANRRKVYNISLAKFIKSLYNNKNSSLYGDGFALASARPNADPKEPYVISPLNPDMITVESNSGDSRKLNASNGQMLLICYGRPVTERDLYTQQNTLGNVFRDNRQYMMCLLYGNDLEIYPDGTYTGKLQIAPVNSQHTFEQLNNVLPLEYVPEELVAGEMENMTASVLDSISKHLESQMEIYPQEKLHLHTDRDLYVPGEKIWFKAYLADAATGQTAMRSRYVYVELISPTDSLVSRVMIRPDENGLFHGYLFLSDVVPEDVYTLRAYTQYMCNIGDDYFFKKNVRIGNIGSSRLPVPAFQKGSDGNGSSREARTGVSETHAQDDYDVSFFPEGGNPVEGVECKIAFKALNSNGTSAYITGRIIDLDGAEITSVQTLHAGMGIFSFKPERGKAYFLHCIDADGVEKRFELPRANFYARALTVDRRSGAFTVSVNRNPLSPDVPGYLLAHCRGKVVYFDMWDKDDNSVDFFQRELPTGIIHFLLLDSQLTPLSERLVFNRNHEDDVTVDFHTDKTDYGKREKIIASLSLADVDENILEGNLSVAVTDDADVAVDSTVTILSTMLLSSELKGYIENPSWYLQDTSESETALDCLMLTHGWNRYHIPDVVKGDVETPRIPYQTGQQISGSVQRSGLFGRTGAVVNSEVVVMLQDGSYGNTLTDTDGRFLFHDFEYPDSTTFFFQSSSNRGGNRFEIRTDEVLFPAPVHAPFTVATQNGFDMLSASGRQNAFITKAGQRARFDEDMWSIYLGEVEVTARRRPQEEPRRQFWANELSDATIRREQIEKLAFSSVKDYLKMISGVTVSPDGVINIRAAMNLEGELLQPLILIDGIMMSSEDLDDLSYVNVESIDVFKGTGTSAFGVRGANGVISVTTKRGSKTEAPYPAMINFLSYTPLGYQKPVEFYSPSYDTPEAKNSTIPDLRTTIFWKPALIVSGDGRASFEFYSSDFPTTYSIVIEGLTTDGKIIRYVKKIK